MASCHRVEASDPVSELVCARCTSSSTSTVAAAMAQLTIPHTPPEIRLPTVSDQAVTGVVGSRKIPMMVSIMPKMAKKRPTFKGPSSRCHRFFEEAMVTSNSRYDSSSRF